MHEKEKTVLWLSLPLAALVIVISSVGLITPGFYATETINWQTQAIGQDMANLFIAVPALLLSAFFSYHKRKGAVLIWGGVVAYFLYTFVIYCFTIHFNKLFILYCFILGISFYSMLWFLLSQLRKFQKENFENIPSKTIGIYIIILAVLFYFLWLSEIIPSIISNETPKTVKDAGLFTNPVHVIDLAVFLPAMFISGIFLLKRKLLGYIIAPVLLSFFVLMDITIGGLIILMKERGLEGEYAVAAVMGLLAIASAAFLISYIRQLK